QLAEGRQLPHPRLAGAGLPDPESPHLRARPPRAAECALLKRREGMCFCSQNRSGPLSLDEIGGFSRIEGTTRCAADSPLFRLQGGGHPLDPLPCPLAAVRLVQE